MTQERRSCTRLKTLECVDCILRLGKREFVVTLLDQSANGCQVRVHSTHGFSLGTQMLLFLNGTWTEVRLVRVERRPNETRLGLKREFELPNDDDLEELKTTWRSFFPRFRASRMTTGVAVGGLGLVIFLGVAGWLLQDFVLSMRERPRQDNAARTLIPIDTRRPETPVVFQPVPVRTSGATSETRPTQGTAGNASQFADAARALFRASFDAGGEREGKALGMLKLIAAVCDKKTIDKLQLSRNQMDSVQRMVLRGQTLLTDRLSSRIDDATLSDIQQLYDQVCSVLNSRQRQLLESMLQE